MKILIKIVSFFILNLAVFPAFSQDSHTSNTTRRWYKPDHAVAQFAGNIGLASAGVGYSYLKDKMQTDILYGYVPSFESETGIHIFTAKTSLHPFAINMGEKYVLEPLRLGTGVSYSAGSQFFTSLPKRYSDSYYWWASSLRITPFIGTAISRKIGTDATTIKRVQLYGELGTTDLDLVSKFSNTVISTWDILNLAIGTKLVF